MEGSVANARRITAGLIFIGLSLILISVALPFISVFVYAVFLYYAVRPVHRALERFGIPKRIRAATSLIAFGIPLTVIVAYTTSVVFLEAQSFIETYDVQTALITQLLTDIDLAAQEQAQIREAVETIRDRLLQGYGVVHIQQLVTTASSAVVQLIIMLILTYSMLVDGPRLRRWVVGMVDKKTVVESFFNEVDNELSRTLFGNIVNVFVTAIIAITVFTVFNMLSPSSIQIPFPALLGSLAGIGSLIPIFGIKLVYIPLTAWLGATAWITGEHHALGTIVVFFIVSLILIDFIPDMFVRAIISGPHTHTGLLVVAYITGPATFGFYGLFLAPILLVLTLSAGYTLVPYALTGDPPNETQSTLQQYVTDDQSSVYVESSDNGEQVPLDEYR